MHACMRTTVELSESTYHSVRAEMLRRGERGFSPIVEEALVSYLARAPERERIAAAIAAADGAWSEDDVLDLERRRADVWSTWQTDRFSTPTS
jgi:hypothetical protein